MQIQTAPGYIFGAHMNEYTLFNNVTLLLFMCAMKIKFWQVMRPRKLHGRSNNYLL